MVEVSLKDKDGNVVNPSQLEEQETINLIADAISRGIPKDSGQAKILVYHPDNLKTEIARISSTAYKNNEELKLYNASALIQLEINATLT